MDWDVDEFRDLTIEVDFVKCKKLLFRATTWVPFVGCLTGMRLNPSSLAQDEGFSVSLNYRKCKVDHIHLVRNVFAGFTSCWALEFLIRNTLENCTTFDQAVNTFTSSNIMAPCYLIVAGPKRDQAVQINRTRLRDVNRLTFSGLVGKTRRFKKREDENDPSNTQVSNGKIHYLLQTNCDHWKTKIMPKWAAGDVLLLNALERRTKALALLDSHMDWSAAQSELDQLLLLQQERGENVEHSMEQKDHPLVQRGFHVLSQFPVLNQDTVYQVVMQPSTNTYVSRVVYDPPIWSAQPDKINSTL